MLDRAQQPRGIAIHVTEGDDRTGTEIFESLGRERRISEEDYHAIKEVVQNLDYRCEPGRQHVLTVLEDRDVYEETCSLAKLLALGLEARLEAFSPVVALLALEQKRHCFPRERVVFAHERITVPGLEVVSKQVTMALMLHRNDYGKGQLGLVRVKRGRQFRGDVSLAFGRPLPRE